MNQARWLIIRGYIKLSLGFIALHYNLPAVAMFLFMFSLYNFITAILK